MSSRAPLSFSSSSPLVVLHSRYKFQTSRGSSKSKTKRLGKKEMVSRSLLTYTKPVPGKMFGYQSLAVDSVEITGEQETLLDTFFEFLDGSVDSSGNGFDDLKEYEERSGEDEEGDGSCCDAEKKREFWESQERLLLATLCRTTSIETRIRRMAKDFLRDLELGDLKCCCGKDSMQGCRSCSQREVRDRLVREGLECTVCKSKWKSSPEIPSGEHTYIQVLDRSNPKRATTRVIVELNFRAEFEMAKASDEYNRLIDLLPAVFVGKAERLSALIKIICCASKRCMRDRNVHIGPWRKHKYMQAKWLGTTTHEGSSETLPTSVSVRSRPKQGASLLTHEMVDIMIPGIQCRTVVEVVV